MYQNSGCCERAKVCYDSWINKTHSPGLAFRMSHSMREKKREMDIMKSLSACVHQGDHLLLKIKFHLLNHFPRLSVVTK